MKVFVLTIVQDKIADYQQRVDRYNSLRFIVDFYRILEFPHGATAESWCGLETAKSDGASAPEGLFEALFYGGTRWGVVRLALSIGSVSSPLLSRHQPGNCRGIPLTDGVKIMKNRSSANDASNSSAVSSIGNIDHISVGKDAPAYAELYQDTREALSASYDDRDAFIASLLARVSLLEKAVLELTCVK